MVRLPCCLGAFCLEPFWGCCLFRFLPFWGKHEWGNGFRGFLCFSLPFSLLAGGKGNGFCWVSLFSLPFPASQAEKGNGFRGFLCFWLPFRFLPFWGKHEWGNGFWEFPRFSLPFGIIQNATYPMSPSP